jgi:hypothetical protein
MRRGQQRDSVAEAAANKRVRREAYREGVCNNSRRLGIVASCYCGKRELAH